jgi:hypothetical protein
MGEGADRLLLSCFLWSQLVVQISYNTTNNWHQPALVYLFTSLMSGVYVPERQNFQDAFFVLSLPLLSSKTKETTFQILKRTVWTNNKAFKSGMHNSPLCNRCDGIETIEDKSFY